MGSLGITNLTPLQAMWAGAPTMAIADGVDEVHKVTVARNVLKGYQPHPGLWPTEYIPAKREQARKKYASLLAADPDLAAWADRARAGPDGQALIMHVGQRVAVVTGGASGIGRSLCLAFADQDAAAVVVADVDAEGAAEVAAMIEAGGHRGMAVATDVASAADVETLVTRTEDAFGHIDLFCSNAGIIVGGGVEVPDEAWARSWAVNVQSHVYAARAVLPRMLARRAGYVVYTASAAGLLTELGSAPYSMTKHAVVALAEWLSITYGDWGIRVSCLCPQAVRTNLGATSRRQVGADTSLAGRNSGAMPQAPVAGILMLAQAAVDGVLTPDQVAACVIDALAEERFLILPHPEVATYERRRAADRERWLRGMRRLRARLGGP